MAILGLNTADAQDMAVEFLEENGATFPTILDSSPAAREALAKYETLGMRAVPLTYVVDREGNVAGAWYGYEEGHPKGKRILQRLGVR